MAPVQFRGGAGDPVTPAPIATARAWKSNTQAVPTFASTMIALDRDEAPTGTALEIVPNGVRVKVAGVVDVAASMWADTSTTTERNLGITVNGVNIRQTGAGSIRNNMADVLRVNAGDVIGVSMYTATAFTVKGGATKDTGVTVTYLGPAT